MGEKLKIVSGVLLQDNQILLCLRKNTEFYPNHWAFPVGRLEQGENYLDALRRELFEEIGVQLIEAENLTTLYDYELNVEHVVYRVNVWRGQIENLEPELCESVAWFSLADLPQPLTPATQKIIDSLSCGA